MNCKFLILLCLAILPFRGFAQNAELIDRLQKNLVGLSGVDRFNALNQLAWECRSVYPDTAIRYARHAIALGDSLKIEKNMARPYNYMGVAYNYKGDRVHAYEAYDEAIEIATLHNDSLELGHASNNLGRLFLEQGLMARAYDYFIIAETTFKALGDPSGQAYVYQSLARLYHSQNDDKKAENNLLKANQIRIQLGNTSDIASAFIQTARFYQDVGQHQNALKYLSKADSTTQSIHDEFRAAEIKVYMARSYLLDGAIELAKKIGRESLEVISRKNNVRLQPQALITMGEIEFANNNMKSASDHFQSALAIASRTRDLQTRMDANYNLSKIYEREKNSTRALTYMNRYLTLLDSSKDLDLARQVERFQFEMEIERIDRENANLKVEQARQGATIKQQRRQNILLIIISVLISFLGIVLWRNLKKRNEVNEKLGLQNQFIENQRQEIIAQNEQLSRHNHQLSELNHEKDTLMGIVAHDLKSPLNRIKGLSTILEMEDRLSEIQRSYLNMMQDATRAGLDLITDLLDVHMLEENVEPKISTVDVSAFMIGKVSAFQQAADAKKINLAMTRIDNVTISTDADYLNRIMDNLISNAIKFSRQSTDVALAAFRNDGYLHISLTDNGPGFSEKDKALLFQKFRKLSARPTAGESSNGLGLAIVKTLVDRLKGTISLTSEQGKGSEFIVRLPIR